MQGPPGSSLLVYIAVGATLAGTARRSLDNKSFNKHLDMLLSISYNADTKIHFPLTTLPCNFVLS